MSFYNLLKNRVNCVVVYIIYRNIINKLENNMKYLL